MIPPNLATTAIISVVSALAVVILKDVILAALQQRRGDRRALLLARVEHAYSPLEFLAFKLFHTDNVEHKATLLDEIGTVLRSYGHLLSAHTAAAFYTLLEDENGGAYLLHQHFYQELQQLKEEYYHNWYSHRSLYDTSPVTTPGVSAETR